MSSWEVRQRDYAAEARAQAAIMKRFKAAYHMVKQYDAYLEFEALVELLNETGAFHDCPSGTSPGSCDSGNASSRARSSIRSLRAALHDALNVHQSSSCSGESVSGRALCCF